MPHHRDETIGFRLGRWMAGGPLFADEKSDSKKNTRKARQAEGVSRSRLRETRSRERPFVEAESSDDSITYRAPRRPKVHSSSNYGGVELKKRELEPSDDDITFRRARLRAPVDPTIDHEGVGSKKREERSSDDDTTSRAFTAKRASSRRSRGVEMMKRRELEASDPLHQLEEDEARARHEERRYKKKELVKLEEDRARARRYYDEGRYKDAERIYGRLKRVLVDADGNEKTLRGSPGWLLDRPERFNDWYHLALTLCVDRDHGEGEWILRQLSYGRREILEHYSDDLTSPNAGTRVHVVERVAASMRQVDECKIRLAQMLVDQDETEQLTLLVDEWFADYEHDHCGNDGRFLGDLAVALSSNESYPTAYEVMCYAVYNDDFADRYRHCALVELGRALNGQQKWTAAKEVLLKASWHQPESDLYEILRLWELSTSLEGQERYDEAKSQYEMMIKLGEASLTSTKTDPVTATRVGEKLTVAKQRLQEMSEHMPTAAQQLSPTGSSGNAQNNREETMAAVPTTSPIPLRPVAHTARVAGVAGPADHYATMSCDHKNAEQSEQPRRDGTLVVIPAASLPPVEGAPGNVELAGFAGPVAQKVHKRAKDGRRRK
jgi:hypothetical protein